MQNAILIVEDDLTFATMLKTWLTKKGFIVETASNNARARKLLETTQFNIILSDLRLPDKDGLFLLSWMKENGYNIPLIIMTGYADIQGAVQAIKDGANDYVSKPIQPDILLEKINEILQNSVERKSIKTSVDNSTNITPSQESSSCNQSPEFMEGESEAARNLYGLVSLVAPTPMSVLINGASGTGKEYVAHRIHQLSKRADKPFIAIDCGSIPKELAASEFFGHVKGSFTGALNDKVGAFVEANGGTLFLDEIGNLSYEVQVQLLRAIQERRVRQVGSTKEIEVDVRLVSATNENLPQAIIDGRFREDLFHRINEFTLRMPSLNERKDDIMLFANFFLDQANRELEKSIIGFDQSAISVLQNYSWPGNLRQLKNIVKRATLLTQGDFISLAEIDLDPEQATEASRQHSFCLYDEDEEKSRIIETLRRTGNNKSKAALLLGIDRKTLYNKMKQYNIVL